MYWKGSGEPDGTREHGSLSILQRILSVRQTQPSARLDEREIQRRRPPELQPSRRYAQAVLPGRESHYTHRGSPVAQRRRGFRRREFQYTLPSLWKPEPMAPRHG